VIGAIIGDIVGSVHEHARPRTKTTDFPLFTADSRFTDDTVLTFATADALLGDGDYARAYREWGNRYPRAGYGGRFKEWLRKPNAGPYQSYPRRARVVRARALAEHRQPRRRRER
jgi:ADP-ribosylglycohydrolase